MAPNFFFSEGSNGAIFCHEQSLTVAVLVVFAVVAGDSLIGEIQFMIGGFFTFFFMFTVLIAWVF